MKRPQLVHFLAIKEQDALNVRALMAMTRSKLDSTSLRSLEGLNPLNPFTAVEAINALDDALEELQEEVFRPRFPIQALRLLGSDNFTLKLVAMENGQEIFKKTFESDAFGHFFFKIPLASMNGDPQTLHLYESSWKNGLDINLGSYIPLHIPRPKKIVICDFDKTLVDTRYSTTKEVYNSLTRPLSDFPTLEGSLNQLNSLIKQGFHPFILSASPHFYEQAIRDWLYQKRIFTAGIFLKDYRQVFSLFDGDLSPKDIKAQGIYKLTHLLDIINMTGIPDELVLMGDNFESDPLIYLTLAMLLLGDNGPWNLWKMIKRMKAFRPTSKQTSQILTKMYQISNAIEKERQKNPGQQLKLQIFIRKKAQENDIQVTSEFNAFKNLITLYEGQGEEVSSKSQTVQTV